MIKVPREIKDIIDGLEKKGFQAFVVGGCVRDLLRSVEPEDWDVTTNANPEEISKVFPSSFSDNKFGTITVLTDSKNPRLKEVEITPFRKETKYSDKRHPDEVFWAKTIEDDLSRRDFTVNAMAMSLGIKNNELRIRDKKSAIHNSKFTIPKLIDPFDGQKDLKDKTIRAVGNAEERFGEDALRIMRAVRFAVTLGFEIEEKTREAIEKNASWLKAISKERIRDEFMKIIIAYRAADGIELLRNLGILQYIVPELEEGYGVGQNKHHIYECYKHNVLSLGYAAKKKFNSNVRLAALLHDIAKPRVKAGEGSDATFYGHEIVGAKMTAQILNRLKFPKKDIEKVAKLVRYHLFYYNVGEVSESSVRRLVRQVGPENMEELLQVRMADRIGSGVPKAEPYKLRHFQYVIEKVAQDPISAKMLKVNGNDVMKILGINPGPKIGSILDILLGYVLADPSKNKEDFLKEEMGKLGSLSDGKLSEMAKKGKKEREQIEQKRDEMTKKKYWVS